MRCKNCGSENDENLYICQNCGSPLYDEEDNPADNGDQTQVFEAQRGNNPAPNNNDYDKEEERKRKQNIIIIAVLCVILLAIIIGTVIAIVSARNKNEDETSSLTRVSTSETTEETTTQPTTTTTTTETTTETTTTTTTTTTTKAKVNVSLSVNDGVPANVSGGGEFNLGDTVTVKANKVDGYEFDGWYLGSKKVSSSRTYKFTVTKNTNLQAVYAIINQGENSDSEVPNIGDDED